MSKSVLTSIQVRQILSDFVNKIKPFMESQTVKLGRPRCEGWTIAVHELGNRIDGWSESTVRRELKNLESIDPEISKYKDIRNVRTPSQQVLVDATRRDLEKIKKRRLQDESLTKLLYEAFQKVIK